MLHLKLQPHPRRKPDIQTEELEAELDEFSENIFESFLAHIFPDAAAPWHGDPGQHLLYSSARYGDLEIAIPSYPDQTNKNTEIATAQTTEQDDINRVDDGVKLCAHFLWSGALVIAEGVENADTLETKDIAMTDNDTDIWSVKGETVMELGAAAALPSLICALANASRVVATDHPLSPALTGTIAYNMDCNLRNRMPSPSTEISIHPHEWGVLNDTFAQQNKGRFTRIIASDCFFMSLQHQNILRTMRWFLAPGGKIWVAGGFHTGRACVAKFFERALENGFEIERIFERDLIERDPNGKEIRREWQPVRIDEGPENRRRWCVVAVLRWKD
ncbi:hypothetical protein N7490_000566 [Penicillium lividum]|nr:hypothetical protein N7490_000566 [Penicillium lividum]